MLILLAALALLYGADTRDGRRNWW